METREYIKEIDGKIVKKPGYKIVIDSKFFNPTHDMLIANGWELYEEQVLTEGELLSNAINDKIKEILSYDDSKEVNNCYIKYNDQLLTYWADRSERNDLKPAIRDYQSMGNEYYRLDLRELGMSLTLPCEMLLNMLSALEVYAINCFNVTSDHIFAVKALKTIDEVNSYNYKTGYPQKITFEL